MASTLNNLANLHSELKLYDEAEKEYKEALAVYRELAKKSPEKYEPDVAKTLTSLAFLHSPSSSILRRIFGKLFSPRMSEQLRLAKAERGEALAIAEKYPDNPDCKKT